MISWLIIISLLVVILNYIFIGKKNLCASLCYEGFTSLPLVGNSFYFFCKNEDILQKIHSMISIYKGPIRFWLGPKLFLIFKQPHQIEKSLVSPKFSQKHELYDLIKEFLGEGLITAGGFQHKKSRRGLQPFFAMSLITNSFPIMQKHITICMEKLQEKINQPEFNIEPYIHKCYTDAIEEILFGYEANCQQREFNEFETALTNLYNHGFTRLVQFWLHPEIIYKQVPLYKTSLEMKRILRQKIHNMICESWNRRKDMALKHEGFHPLIDQISDFNEQNPGYFDYKTLEDHMLTLYAASEDTLTISSSFAALCLGMYPEYQSKAAEELKQIFGTTPINATVDDLKKLDYLEMCLKDAMRLCPIAPYIIRQPSEDVEIDSYPIPKGVALLIPIFDVHRDKHLWENPDHFYPDHFLPEATKNRHPCSYIPFSVGSRGCIGKLLANHTLKLFLCNLLQHFEIIAEGKVPDVELRMDISTRPKHGYNVRLLRRTWN